MTDEAEITRSVLSDQVKGRLLAAILEGRYPPGARIVETRVAKEFGTSQAPVREALRDLEALGVVENAPFRGARVRQPSVEELLEAFDVRTVLESHAARLAIDRVEEPDLVLLENYLGEMRAAARAGDAYTEARADAAFHAHIMGLSGNATLERVWRTLEPFLRTYITIVSPGIDRQAVADRHEPIIEALRAGDAEGVERTMVEHFRAAAAALGDVWPAPDESGDADDTEAVAKGQAADVTN